jgi:hypothetical protein
MELTDKKNSFFVIPSTGCIGCNHIAVQRFMEQANKENVYLIITNKSLRKLENIKLPENMLLDTNNQIEKLNLEALNTSLIIWNQNKIVSTFILTPDNIDSVLRVANL